VQFPLSPIGPFSTPIAGREILSEHGLRLRGRSTRSRRVVRPAGGPVARRSPDGLGRRSSPPADPAGSRPGPPTALFRVGTTSRCRPLAENRAFDRTAVRAASTAGATRPSRGDRRGAGDRSRARRVQERKFGRERREWDYPVGNVASGTRSGRRRGWDSAGNVESGTGQRQRIGGSAVVADVRQATALARRRRRPGLEVWRLARGGGRPLPDRLRGCVGSRLEASRLRGA